jgi:peptide/nickel transport system substrate-binding protein
MFKCRFIATLVIIFSFLLSSCGSSNRHESTQAVDIPHKSKYGGTITLIIPEEPSSLNPYLADALMVRQISDATIVGLVIPNERGQYEARLVVQIPTVSNGGVSADKKTITWRLRDEIKWSDGEPLTSDDIKYTWQVISNSKSGAFNGTQGFDLITDIETPDQLTAIVHYRTPYVGYLGQFSLGLLPRHATGKPEEMNKWAWNKFPVSTGPFIVTEWHEGESIIMERNPHYFQEGKPFIDRLIFQVVSEPAVQTALMKQGDADVHLWPSEIPDEYAKAVGNVAVQRLVPGIWNMAIDFNLSNPNGEVSEIVSPHPILGDIRVRQAIVQAIDYETLIKHVLQDTVTSTSNPFAYGWYECSQERKLGYDLAKSKELLEQAGWIEGSDGIRRARHALYADDGTKLSLELLGYTNFEPLSLTEQFVAENLKAAGFEIRIQNYDFSTFFGSFQGGSPRKKGNFDMVIYDHGLPIEPQGKVESNWLSTEIPTSANPDGNNIFRWQNPLADQAIKEAGGTFDQSARRNAYCRLGNLIQEDAVQAYLYLFQDNYGFSNRLNGYTLSTWGSMTWDVENWWLDN